VASDMLILDQKPAGPPQAEEQEAAPALVGAGAGPRRSAPTATRTRPAAVEEIDLDDIPF
jgi:hypothetical protein